MNVKHSHEILSIEYNTDNHSSLRCLFVNQKPTDAIKTKIRQSKCKKETIEEIFIWQNGYLIV